VSYKIEDFGVFDSRHVENILDVGKVSSGTQLDEFDAKSDECNQAHLSRITQLLVFFDDATLLNGEIGMIDARNGDAKKEGRIETYP
jgi:hypothetical protein